MKYCVYLLISSHKRRYITYVGYTNNINKRLLLHNTSKGAKFTRGKKWKVIYKKSYDNKSDAMKNEYLLKNNIKKRLDIKKKFIVKYKNK